MNILVTGGAGYIGSRAVRVLLGAGHKVIAYDNLLLGHAAAIPPEVLVEGDLAQTDLLTALLTTNAINAVMHFAGLSRVGESVEHPGSYYQTNVAGTLSLLDAMAAAGTSNLVFSSSCATYGIPQTLPITESAKQLPVNPYGRSKLMVEQILHDLAKARGLSYAALRYFNACGAPPDGATGEDHEVETHLVPIALQVALGQREYIDVFGTDYETPDGTCIRDYIHIDDLVDAHILAMERLEGSGQLTLNLGTGTGHSVFEVLDSCRRVTGHPIPARRARRRAGDPSRLVADATRAEAVLGWSPRYRDMDEIVATAWSWHKNHPAGYRTSPG